MTEAATNPDDPHLWLEEVLGEPALDWVRERNAKSLGALQAEPGYAAMHAELLGVLNASDRIPGVARRGDWFYNLWQDETNKRGLWRRTTLEQYARPEPAWETVLDLDALGAAEGESWVFAGAEVLGPEYRHALLMLSRGGSDAHVVREFDLVAKQFVQGGFELPEAKSAVDWIDADHIYVGTDFGPGSQTDSGYSRIIKRWTRGTPLSQAVSIFEGETQDVAVYVSVDPTPGFERTVLSRMLDFYDQARWLLQADGSLGKLELPDDAQLQFWGPRVLIHPRSDWQIGAVLHKAGSLLVGDAAGFLAGQRDFQLLFTPTETRSLADFTHTRSQLLLTISDKVASRLEAWSFAGETPVHRTIDAPFPGTLSVASLYDSELAQDELAESYLLNYTDFLTPDSLFLASTGNDGHRQLLKRRLPQFEAEGMRAEQHFASSADGTRVPYFVLTPQGFVADGQAPTLLYGYGGFEVSLEPSYSGGRGRAWLARGGVMVVANIRGGGEFGPAWHQAAVKAHKQRSYDDFIAVAEDLIARGITSAEHLGIMGGSNGGLLVGAVFTQRPELFKAVVCQVPLLDMRRYHQLLAGASWMAEYGDPDEPAEWAVIERYSPYQNLRAGVAYPRLLFTTSTRDDRVHPGHARKMAARMEGLGAEVLYYENIEGGHGGAADNDQRATMQALEYAFLWQQLR